MVHVSIKGFNKGRNIVEEMDHADFRTKDVRDRIREIGDIIVKHSGGDHELERVISSLRTLVMYGDGERQLTMDEIKGISRQDLEGFGKISKRKILLLKLQIAIGEYYDNMPNEQKSDLDESGISRKEYITQQVRQTWKSFMGLENEIISALQFEYGLASDVAFFLKEFSGDNNFGADLGIILSDHGISPKAFTYIAEDLPYIGIKAAKIMRDTSFEINENASLTGNFLSLNTDQKKEIVDTRNGFINPNWFLYDIDVESAVKLWGIEKSKYIFGKYFRDGIFTTNIGDKLQLPDFYNLGIFRIKIDADSEGDRQKLIDIGQHIFEWDIDNDFSQKELLELSEGLRDVLSDLKHSGEQKSFKHPVQTYIGAKKYTGYFSGSRGFENTHIIDIQSQDNNSKRVLRFATDMGQDELIFIKIQISYYLKNKKLIPTEELWREIYQMYNTLSLEGVEIFPASNMQEQYDILVKKVVWPLSAEHKEKKGYIGKAHNAVLYGVYGTGKSQLLTHLIGKREYELKNGEEIHLEAIVINISVLEFADLIVKSSSGFRKRLSDMHENTGLPIVLVIEDIDTIVKENGSESDPISQGITTLFEGVGSLPVTVVTSTNSPEILPQRHLRPNRFDTPIGFEYPLNPKIIFNILITHWEKNGLDDLVGKYIGEDYLRNILTPQISDFTPSHISALCLSIYEDLEFEDVDSLNENKVTKIIAEAFSSVLVPAKDMKDRQNIMTRWRESIGGTEQGAGFKINRG